MIELRGTYEITSRRLSSQNVLIVEEELDGIDIDDIGNLEDLLRVVSIDEACGNLKVVIDDGEFSRNINRKRSQIFYNPIDVHSVTNVVVESISSISKLNIANQSGKQGFSCG